jgi:excisionase family DNA binding protein
VSLRQPDGSVVIPPRLAGEVLAALIRDLAARARAGNGRPSKAALELLYALNDAETSGPGSAAAETRMLAVEITAEQAAQVMGCSTRWIRQLAEQGRISGRRVGHLWLLDPASVDRYRKGQ